MKKRLASVLSRRFFIQTALMTGLHSNGKTGVKTKPDAVH